MKTDDTRFSEKRPFKIGTKQNGLIDTITTYFGQDWAKIHAVRNFNPQAD